MFFNWQKFICRLFVFVRLCLLNKSCLLRTKIFMKDKNSSNVNARCLFENSICRRNYKNNEAIKYNDPMNKYGRATANELTVFE